MFEGPVKVDLDLGVFETDEWKEGHVLELSTDLKGNAEWTAVLIERNCLLLTINITADEVELAKGLPI